VNYFPIKSQKCKTPNLKLPDKNIFLLYFHTGLTYENEWEKIMMPEFNKLTLNIIQLLALPNNLSYSKEFITYYQNLNKEKKKLGSVYTQCTFNNISHDKGRAHTGGMGIGRKPKT
jgi:hypothetical protein